MKTGTLKSLIGLKLDEAKVKAEKEGFRLRVMCIDGKSLIGTCDYVANRINVEIQDGAISNIIGIS